MAAGAIHVVAVAAVLVSLARTADDLVCMQGVPPRPAHGGFCAMARRGGKDGGICV
jgi:hypothetical protein